MKFSSHLEMAYPVWCATSQNNLRKLDSVHHQSLQRALGAPTSALEVLSGIMPLSLRLEEVLLQEYIRIMQKPVADPLRCQITSLISDPLHLETKVTSPIHHLNRLIRQMEKKDRFITPLVRIDTPSQQDITLPVLDKINITEEDLGRSGTRTAEQTARAKQLTTDFINNLPNTTLIAFTDGSALGNPGPCGASAVLYPGGITNHHVAYREPISKFGTSYLGELVGIRLALQQALLLADNHHTNELLIFCDCQSAILTVSTVGYESSENRNIITSCRQLTKGLNDKGIATKVTWVCGHAGLIPNEIADEEAKAAAETAKEDDTPTELPASLAKGLIKQHQMEKWQHAWDTATTGRTLYSVIPAVRPCSRIRRPSRSSDTKLSRLKSGFSRLNEHLYRHGKLAETPTCECDQDIEDTRHFLLECERYSQQREEMIDTIESIFIQNETPLPDRTIDIVTLLGGNQRLTPEVTQAIQSAVCLFIKATRRGV